MAWAKTVRQVRLTNIDRLQPLSGPLARNGRLLSLV